MNMTNEETRNAQQIAFDNLVLFHLKGTMDRNNPWPEAVALASQDLETLGVKAELIETLAAKCFELTGAPR